jgi:hypothetical protein
MNRWWSRAATALALLAMVVAALLAVAWLAFPLDGTTITIDGETFSLANLSGWQVVAIFAFGVAVALAALLVAAVAVLLALVVAVLGIAVGVLATVASLALVASPFLLIGWLVWRAVRKPRPAAAVAAA